MKQSETVEKLKETSIVLYSGDSKRDPLKDPDEELVKKAFVKICDEWNKAEGSRKFLKHLIGAFCTDGVSEITSFTESDKTNGVNRCCILGVRVAGTEEIIEGWKVIAEKAEENEKKFYWLSRKLPVEIKNSTVAVKAEKSSKIMSREAYWALKKFVELCECNGEKEVKGILHPEYRKPAGKKYNKGTNVGKQKKKFHGGVNMESMVPDEIWKQLKGIK